MEVVHGLKESERERERERERNRVHKQKYLRKKKTEVVQKKTLIDTRCQSNIKLIHDVKVTSRLLQIKLLN